MNRLRHVNKTIFILSVITTPDISINAPAENNQQEKALLVTADVESELDTSAELNDALTTERIMLQLELMEEHNFTRAKKI